MQFLSDAVITLRSVLFTLETATPLGVWLLPLVLAAVLLIVLVVAIILIRRTSQIKYQFITVGSHKLRTPLSKIKVSVSEILHKKEGADARKEPYTIEDIDERLLRQIAVENNRLVGLVKLLLEVSESETGHAKYQKTTFDLVALVQEVLDAYQHSQWRNDRAFLDFQSSANTMNVTADRQRIASAVQVVLENAITYSPSGGQVLVSLTTEKKRAVFCVKDSGIGILPSEKKNIFSKFWRGSRAMKIDTEGTGVGLFLAKHIIEGHGGKMWFYSGGEHQGSTFCFSLPLG